MADDTRKRPSFPWYPGDWRRDTALQSCSFEVRALWREMLDLMHDGEPYGHLTAGGVPLSAADLARMLGVPARRVVRWMAELDARKVFSRTESGVIYSRRMVRDEHIREVRAAAGKQGGNPGLLVKQNASKPPTNGNQTPEQKPTLAVAVASALAVQPPPPRAEPSAEGALRDLIPERLHGDLETALAECDRPAALVAELMGMTTDAGGTGRTFTGAEIGQGLHDLVANGDHIRFRARLVRRYIEGIRPLAVTMNGNGSMTFYPPAPDAERAFDDALQLIRSTPGGWRQITADTLAALPPPMRAGIRAADGVRALADADEFTLRAKRKLFTAAYLASPQEQPA